MDERQTASTPQTDQTSEDETMSTTDSGFPGDAGEPTQQLPVDRTGTMETGTAQAVSSEPTATWTVPAAPPRRVRVAAVVWGVVVVAVAAGLVAIANGAVFDVQLAGIVLVAAAGLALLVGSLAGARRRA